MNLGGADDPKGASREPSEEALAECQQIAARLVDAWQQGAAVDTAAAMARHPELGQFKSIVRDLAFEEYCQRTERGEAVDIEQFADRFADCRKSLFIQLELHRLIHDCEGLTKAWFSTVWPEPGDEFLGFEIRDCLGQGTFAHVYLATEPAVGSRPVAVKISHSGLEEAGILGKLAHEHIVPIHSVQLDELTGLSAICMPYLGRATLNDVLDRIARQKQVPESSQVFGEAISSVQVGRQPAGRTAEQHRGVTGNYVDAVLTIGMQLADALACAHRHGVYHLDLKPTNVLLTDAGCPMLLDFNLAQDKQQVSARQGGTLPYMAPEQLVLFRLAAAEPISGQPVGDLARSDIYSLGVVLYELLTGRLPFPIPTTIVANDDRVAVLLVAQRTGAAALRSANPRIHESLARLVEKCLAFDPQNRFASAGELAAAIRAEYGVARRVLRWIGGHKRLATAAILLIAGLSVLGASYYRHRRETYYLTQIELGEDFHRQGNYAEAIAAFDRAYADHPAAPEILLHRAEAWMAEGDFAKASSDLQEFLTQRDDPRALVLSAFCWQQTGNQRRAIALYRRAIASGIDTALVNNNLAYACERSNVTAEAKAHAERAIVQDSSLQAPQHNLALVELRLAELRGGKPSLAIAAIQRALKLGAPSAELYRNAAVVYAQAANFDPASEADAIHYVRRAIDAGVNVESLAAYTAIKPLLDQIPPRARTPGTIAPSRTSSVRLLNPLERAAAPPQDLTAERSASQSSR